MKISVDNYIIYSDAQKNVWITEIKINPKTNKPYETRVSGYCRDLTSALEDMVKRKVYGSDTTNLVETINTIQNALNDALEIIRKGDL